MVKKLFKVDDNLLSFLCGIFSNIPISLLFTIAKWGNNWFEHTIFLIWIVAFIFSIILTTSAISITLRKISIQKMLDETQGEMAKENALQLELSKRKNDKGLKNSTKFRISIVIFLISAILLFLLLVAVWVLNNFV